MTAKEIAADFTKALAESGNGRVWAFVEAYMEKAVIAGIEEDRKTRKCCKAERDRCAKIVHEEHLAYTEGGFNASGCFADAAKRILAASEPA